MKIHITIVSSSAETASKLASWLVAEPSYQRSIVRLRHEQLSELRYSSRFGVNARMDDMLFIIDIDTLTADAVSRSIAAVRALPNSKLLLVFSRILEPSITLAAIRAGVTGFVFLSEGEAILRQSISLVMNGEAAVPSMIAAQMLAFFRQAQTPSVDQDLTLRERQILRCLGNGDMYKEITISLGISQGTLNTHIRNLYRKLGVNSRSQAVAFAFGKAARAATKNPKN